MVELFKFPAYRTLFSAQLIALIGTGLTTIALALLAYDLAGSKAGIVLGTALAIKMIAYVFVSPIITGLIKNKNRKKHLILFDIARAITVIFLFFVDSIWQIYLLIFCLQSLSAGFTPVYQSVISDILKEDRLFVKGASLSRIAYNMENILSPSIAILILSFVSYSVFFIANTLCFLFSALLIITTKFPEIQNKTIGLNSVWKRVTSGITQYVWNRNLLGLLSLNMCVSASGAMILVNSVSIVQGFFGLSESELAMAMLFYGLGSILSAILVFLNGDKAHFKTIMLLGALLTGVVSFGSAFIQSYPHLLFSWFSFGFSSSLILVPVGQILREETNEHDRTAIFGAQFSLSHACWLLTYPVMGYVLLLVGLKASFFIIASLVICTTFIAWFLWFGLKDKSSTL